MDDSAEHQEMRDTAPGRARPDCGNSVRVRAQRQMSASRLLRQEGGQSQLDETGAHKSIRWSLL